MPQTLKHQLMTHLRSLKSSLWPSFLLSRSPVSLATSLWEVGPFLLLPGVGPGRMNDEMRLVGTDIGLYPSVLEQGRTSSS